MSDLDAARSGSQRIRCSAVVVVSEARYRQCLCNFSCFFFFHSHAHLVRPSMADGCQTFSMRLTAGFSVPLLVVYLCLPLMTKCFRRYNVFLTDFVLDRQQVPVSGQLVNARVCRCQLQRAVKSEKGSDPLQLSSAVTDK